MVIWRRENIHQHVNGTAPVSALNFLKSTQTDLKPRDWLLGLHIWTNQDLRRSRLSKRLSAKPLRQSEEKGLGNVLISDYEFYLND